MEQQSAFFLHEVFSTEQLPGVGVAVEVGVTVGVGVGDDVGAVVGETVGDTVGADVGDGVGAAVGETVGDAVGAVPALQDLLPLGPVHLSEQQSELP